MILSDRDLRLRMQRGDVVIEPLEDPELQIQPASVDLRLSSSFVVYRGTQVACIDPRDPRTVESATEAIEVAPGDGFVLQPGAFALGSTVERVRVPEDLVARVEGRSSVGRLAVVVHATAGFIDPGFDGRITLELSNLGRCAVKLYPGMRISQVVFHVLSSPAERPYGRDRGSKYQGQEGPVVSRINRDRESRS